MATDSPRIVTHFDLDAFFVSVECHKNSALKGKPLIVGGQSDRGVVTSCSYEARKFGVHSAMPMKLATRLCPQAIIVQGDFESYSYFSKIVTDIISSEVPVFEKASIDEFYIDMSGMEKYFGCRKFTDNLKKKILRESGLPVSYGLATNKLVSKVATNEVKPDGQVQVAAGNEKSFLAPLAIHKMPMIGEKTARLLKQMGIALIRTLSEIPVEMLNTMFGKPGKEMWRRANGIDETPVIPYHEQKSISTENTFQSDTIDVAFMKAQLVRMTEQLAFELRSQNRLTGCVTVKLRYSSFDTFTRQKTIPYTSHDHTLMAYVSDLFEKLYDRRLLVRMIGVRFTHLIPGNYQINLFHDREEHIRLYRSVDSIKFRFGSHLIRRASGMIN
jgi:DNA polymerase IV